MEYIINIMKYDASVKEPPFTFIMLKENIKISHNGNSEDMFIPLSDKCSELGYIFKFYSSSLKSGVDFDVVVYGEMEQCVCSEPQEQKVFNTNKTASEIAKEIGLFYFNKHSHLQFVHEQVNKATKELDQTMITNISFDNRVISITTKRPGILIGHHGKNIDSLAKHLKKKFGDDILINIIEEQTLNELYSFQYAVCDPADYIV